MPTSPAHSISLAKQYLKAALAASATFQAWTGSADSAEAAARIYREALPRPDSAREYTAAELSALRPYAIVGTLGYRSDADAGGAERERWATGRLLLRLVMDVPAEAAEDEEELSIQFENVIGGIERDLYATSGLAGYLDVRGFELPAPYMRTHPDQVNTEGDAVGVEIVIEWAGI